MNYFDIRKAVSDAEEEIRTVENNAYQLGGLASKPFVLRNFSVNDLIKIKKQLKDFNMHTLEWKGE
jgi:hypothetical protein